MSSDSIVVLGASNTGASIAAKLALEGHEVILWEAPESEAALAPIAERGEIQLTGVAGEGTAKLAAATTDVEVALAAGSLLVASVPAYAHGLFADLLSGHLRADHILALLPGNLGTFAFAETLRRLGVDQLPLLVEADTAPYVCRKLGPAHAHIWGAVTQLGLGTLPGEAGGRALAALEPLFPGATLHPNALVAGISALNPVVHPPGVLMNAGRIEYSKGEFCFYEEGVTPAVVKAIEALDAERLALGAAFGYELLPVAAAFSAAGFGPVGDLWATINGSRMLTQMRAPGSVETRWLSEDVPFGIRTWAELGAKLGVEMPVARALVALGDVQIGADSWSVGRSLADLGIADLDRDQILALAASGVLPVGSAAETAR